MKKFYNKKTYIVYDAHEYETEVNGLKGIKKKLTKIVEKYCIKYADKVITVSNAIANEYVRLYNIEKPTLILNTPGYKKISKTDIFREKFNLSKTQTIFLYQGGLNPNRGIETILDAFKKLNNISLNEEVIIFMGYGQLESKIIEATHQYDNIFFHPPVAFDILLEYTSSVDVGILFYENNCLNHYYCSPNKIFEYIMAEIPVIVSNLYEMNRLVKTHGIGCVACENTVNGLIKAIKEMRSLNKEDLIHNIRSIKTIYNWGKQEKILLNLYKSLKIIHDEI
jgi:glycosyltransferase involved in cell wall biosynthesis